MKLHATLGMSLLGVASQGLLAQAPGTYLKVEAGEYARKGSLVTVEAPARLPERPALKKRDGSGTVLPLQEAGEGKLVFVLPELEAGQSAVFQLVSLPQAAEAAAVAKEEDGAVSLTVGGKLVTTYHGEATKPPKQGIDPIFSRGGYLHPVATPEGRIVTNDYPGAHLHHHGIWLAWTKTHFEGKDPDFWNIGQRKGRVDFVSLDSTWSGPVHAGVAAKHRYIALTGKEPKAALEEAFTVRVYATGEGYHLFDLQAEQTTSGKSALELPEYHYGGLGIRGSGDWEGRSKPRILSSEGETDRERANGKPARWFYMGDHLKEGGAGGIAVLCHPDNFRAPQPVRVHPGEPFLSLAPQTQGEMSIKAGETYRMNYRFVATDGEADAELLERLWNDYAHPPAVRWNR